MSVHVIYVNENTNEGSVWQVHTSASILLQHSVKCSDRDFVELKPFLEPDWKDKNSTLYILIHTR